MNNDISSTQRIEWIDIAKGLGIFLVIAGHSVCVNENNSANFFYNFIYSFHMPLFFIISGMLFKENGNLSKKYIKKISYSYLVPYAVYSLIYLALFYIFALYNNSPFSWNDFRIIRATSLCGLAPLWFLISLFFASLLFSFVLNKLEYSKIKVLIFMIFNVVVSIILAIVFDWLGNRWMDNNLMGIFRIFPIFSFFAFGYLFKNYCACTKKRAVLIVVLSFVLQILLCYFFNQNIDLQLFKLGNPILYFIKSINGSIMIIYISQIISPCKTISFIGKKTKQLMILHYPPFYFIIIIRKVISLFLTNSFLVLLFTSVLTLIICLLIDKLLSYFKVYRLSMGLSNRQKTNILNKKN